MRAIDLLERVPLFAGVERAELERLAGFTKEIDVPAGWS